MAEEGYNSVKRENSDDMNRSLVTMETFEGLNLPPHPLGSWDDKIKGLRHMKLRDDDVMLLTYPKAGTHWLWEVISMLRKGKAEHDKSTKVQLMMEIIDNKILDEMPSPRTLNTHLPLSFLPLSEMKARRLKLVHVYRNPKSTCVSMYHMAKSSNSMVPLPVDTFEQFYEAYFFGTKQMYGSYFHYLRQVHTFQKENPDAPSLNLSYEDSKKDSVDCLKKLAQFLCLTVSDELCSQIAQECSFDNMKKQEAEKAMPNVGEMTPEFLEKMKGDLPIIYRKGEISDWKNHFTVAMNERVDDLIKKEMEGLPFTLTFE